MIRVRMGIDDLQRVRFGRSPLTEAAESLWILLSGQVHPAHQGWYDHVRERVDEVDLDLLRTVVPGTGAGLADLLMPSDSATTMEQQLRAVAEMPTGRLADDLRALWPEGLPERARELLADPAGPRRLAAALEDYWAVAVAPYWDRIRAVTDEDVAHRAATLTGGGVAAMFDGLHHRVRLRGDELQIATAQSADRRLEGGGMRLVPSVFAWPYLVFDIGSMTPNSLVYPARGVGDLWEHPPARRHDDPLAELLGRTRAAVLVALAVPRSTTELARELGQSAPAVSAHLSILRRSGLAESWRSGRVVCYRQTALGRSVATTGTPATGGDDDGDLRRP